MTPQSFKIFAVTALLSVCACSGEMQGVVQGSSERPKIAYEQGMDQDHLTVTMPDGEVFDGKLVMSNKSTTVANVFAGSLDGFGIGTTSDGKMVGKLFSNNSRVMNCVMQYADSSGFTTSGGVGECQIVGGPKIDVLW